MTSAGEMTKADTNVSGVGLACEPVISRSSELGQVFAVPSLHV